MSSTRDFAVAMIQTAGYEWSAEFALGFVCASAHAWSSGLVSGSKLMRDVNTVEELHVAIDELRESGIPAAHVLLAIEHGITIERAAELTPQRHDGSASPVPE